MKDQKNQIDDADASSELTEIATFVRRHLTAEAAVAVAALTEASDDVYLAQEAEARSFFPTTGKSLAPHEGRWAVPGGKTPALVDLPEGSITTAPLFAVAKVSADHWIAYVGSKRDAAGTRINHALLIEKRGDALTIVGRAAVDSLTRAKGLTWVDDGGEAVPLDVPVSAFTVMRLPIDAAHASYLESVLSPA